MLELDLRSRVKKYRKIVQIITLVGLILSMIIIYFISCGTYFKPENQGGMFTVHLRQLGFWGPLFFIGVQIFQVVIPIIPGGMTSVAGNFVFGTLIGFIYNYIGITIGSIIAFFLARKYGKFFILCFISEKCYKRYMAWTSNVNRFAWILGTLFFLPAAPDDILCMIAGLTSLSFKKFILIFIPTKAVSTFVFTWLIQEGILYSIDWLTHL
ncbi:TVP38/TMEM64 family protein [Facklamia sp. P13055]|uniref:TVP38/TMEM64 family protein n=1 Tax=Facklamia sp. P13055 TaxID=3421952 RepID=UPI003D168F10